MRHPGPLALSSALVATLLTSPASAAEPATTTLPAGAWTAEQVDAILATTDEVRLAPDLSALGSEERRAVSLLLEAGAIFERLYEDSRHQEAVAAGAALQSAHAQSGGAARTARLLDLFRLFQGPIATTLDNRREPFLGGPPELPGKNVYPLDATREELDAYLAAHPDERAAILGERTVVRRADAGSLARDRAALVRHPALVALHPGLEARLAELAAGPDAKRFYAVPQSVAWADELTEASRLLFAAATALAPADGELAGYLANRARDLLSDDYESGDAAWVTGRFRSLNVEIGSYETYDDALYGAKAFHGLSLLLLDAEATAALRRALGDLQAIEDALPYEGHKKVRSEIPIGVYDVVADFGQARGTNSATILPNDPLFSRRYGRTILLRRNILENPTLFGSRQRSWREVVIDSQGDDLVPAGDVQRVLWHEIGHYLGVDRDAGGRTLDEALADSADPLEEMKSDLVSLFANEWLHGVGLRDDPTWEAVRASGIRRTFQNNRPRRDEPYPRMQLVQFNWFLDAGLLAVTADRRLEVRYERYPQAVTSLLGEVLRLQRAGDGAAAAEFLDRWNAWDALHDELAERIRRSQGPRFHIVRYAALGE